MEKKENKTPKISKKQTTNKTVRSLEKEIALLKEERDILKKVAMFLAKE